ncbi:prepilin-type N-terminal cleavage/methylation domain-containing protein [Saccharibacillus sp. CPCC 101409]|uniref:prepilin-type N-terminal cleavage/methylation domain-containing protein n=1 Tax=Saccharibacillus sp. CPCC 101409 TaxID=3058041 RepID=UPI002672060D|nr:prepilin-type N-terminal cleavage/methylation domain-containing protein [Saccharibacillus sp. CPCC 101409]MDO3412052.1 prepilin-type N-terminal cleavage/methylation domain-containing protein [Saccharibacillus sp. CPCC 101409]
MLARLKREEGFTLIEVLAAMLILAIAALAFTAYFGNALTYSKTNQNKTIMSNLARNALVYMQKQDFDRMGAYFVSTNAAQANGKAAITSDTFSTCAASDTGVCAFKNIFKTKDLGTLSAILSPSVNGVAYRITIAYQPGLSTKNDGSNLLLPISATVSPATAGSSGPGADSVTVEGYVNAESIR